MIRNEQTYTPANKIAMSNSNTNKKSMANHANSSATYLPTFVQPIHSSQTIDLTKNRVPVFAITTPPPRNYWKTHWNIFNVMAGASSHNFHEWRQKSLPQNFWMGDPSIIHKQVVFRVSFLDLQSTTWELCNCYVCTVFEGGEKDGRCHKHNDLLIRWFVVIMHVTAYCKHYHWGLASWWCSRLDRTAEREAKN